MAEASWLCVRPQRSEQVQSTVEPSVGTSLPLAWKKEDEPSGFRTRAATMVVDSALALCAVLFQSLRVQSCCRPGWGRHHRSLRTSGLSAYMQQR